jgi:hypothetical protein
MDERHYLPILKGRLGEYRALGQLAPEVRAGLTPLIEIPPVPWDFENDRPDKTIDQHLGAVGHRLREAWLDQRPLFVDLLWIAPEERMADGRHPVAFAIDAARRETVRVVPVTGLERADEYQSAVAEAIAQDHLGVMFRLDDEQLTDLGAAATEIHRLMERLGVGPGDVDLLVDLGEVSGNESVTVMGLTAILAGLPHIPAWRSLVVASSAFPDNLARFPAGTLSTTSRVDWSIWLALRGRQLPRPVSFGDYGINAPVQNEIDPRIMLMSASIRYTLSDRWLILKGRNVRAHGFQQFFDLSSTLVARTDFAGAAFSAADRFIDRCSRREEGPGNATTWRQVGTNHHLTRVFRDIAQL